MHGHWPIWTLTIAGSILYANAFEWVIHKYVLHGLGRNRKSLWSFHWIDHHGSARRNGFIDPDYYNVPFSRWDAQTREILAMLGAAVFHAPLLWISPLSYAVLSYCGLNYYLRHRKAHTDPEWAKRKLPWHYDHHMGANQNLNWCVTKPWFDIILGTRKSYVAEKREKE